MTQGSFSLCSKCGNIKPAGATDCEFCGAGKAQPVSLADLKLGMQAAQQPAGSVEPAQPASQTATATAPESTPVEKPIEEKPVEEKPQAHACCDHEKKHASPESGSGCPFSTVMGWIKRLFKF